MWANPNKLFEAVPEYGDYARVKGSGNLIVVDYVEISTKGRKLSYKVYDTSGNQYDIKQLCK